MPRGSLFSPLRVMLGVTLGIVILHRTASLRYPRSRSPGRMSCQPKALAVRLSLYAEEYGDKYPPTEQWCDLLATKWRSEGAISLSEGQEEPMRLRNESVCRSAQRPDVGPAVRVSERMESVWRAGVADDRDTTRAAVCCLWMGTVKFIKAEEIVGLKWTDEKAMPADVRNARRPRDEGEAEILAGEHDLVSSFHDPARFGRRRD